MFNESDKMSFLRDFIKKGTCILVFVSLLFVIINYQWLNVTKETKEPSASPQTVAPIASLSQEKNLIEKLYDMGNIPWLDYIDSLNSDGLAPLTKEVQQWIYEKQHPKNCENVQLLIVKGANSGLGSIVHRM